MTTIKFSVETQAYTIVNEGRTAYIPKLDFVRLYASLDADLAATARKALECAGEIVAVPSSTNARGMRPRNAQRHGVIQ